MTPDERLGELFELAAPLRPAERERFLAERAEDESVLSELRDLLNAHDVASKKEPWKRSALANQALHEHARREQLARHSEIGELVGNYRLTELIGAGGMGIVYRAVRADDEYEQSIAIKRIKPGFDADLIVTRFRSERQILANLEHPNIARLLDGATDSHGLPYLVM